MSSTYEEKVELLEGLINIYDPENMFNKEPYKDNHPKEVSLKVIARLREIVEDLHRLEDLSH